MKLATKSINVHPAVAVFLTSVKQMRSSCASPSPAVLEETDGEMDLNYLLEKQIEDISSSANASKEGISEDILLGVNGGNATHYFINLIFDLFKCFAVFLLLFLFSSFLPFLFGLWYWVKTLLVPLILTCSWASILKHLLKHCNRNAALLYWCRSFKHMGTI